MTDWAQHVAHRAVVPEPARWTLSAVSVVGMLVAGTALANWLDLRPGLDQGLQDAMLIDIASLPAVEALADLPPTSEPPAPPAPAPDEPVVPEAIDDIAPPEDMAEPAQLEPEDLPEPEMADMALPRQEMPPSPVPLPDKKPAKKPEKKQTAEARPKQEKARKPQPAPAAASKAPKGKAAQASQSGTVSASQVERWRTKVSAQVGRHMQRARFDGRKVRLNLNFNITGGGQVTGVSLASSSGDAALDSKVLAHARRLASVMAPPSGNALSLTLPIGTKR